MAYEINYRLQWVNTNNQTVVVVIEDTASPEGTAVYTELTGGEFPVKMKRINNGEDPFAPILAYECKIEFLSTATENIITFSAGADNRFKVTVTIAGSTEFIGFLVMDDNIQDYQPATTNIPVTLTATDNLGTLKDVELTASGTPITDGHYSILDHILWCTNSTGLLLNINLVWNVYEDDGDTDKAPLAEAFIHTLTFEKDIGVKENAYTVLEKLLTSLHARLFQEDGEWWVVRIHEHRRSAAFDEVFKYTSASVLISQTTELTTHTIGPANNAYLSNETANIQPKRPSKEAKDLYRFEYPREIIPNIDFTRGTFISGTNPKLYTIANWTTSRRGTSVSVTPYIRKEYNSNNEEISRYVVIPAGSGGFAQAHFIHSVGLTVHAGDKIRFSADWKLGTNITVGGDLSTKAQRLVELRLAGEDGSHWDLYNGDVFTPIAKPRWISGTAGTHTLFELWEPGVINEQLEWTTFDIEVPPFPVSGDLTICLFEFASTTYGHRETHWTNLKIDYSALINGNHARYAGQYNKVSSSSSYKAENETDLSLAQSPKKIFKGAIKKLESSKYVLTEGWTDLGTGSGSGTSVTLGKIMAYDVWNQYRIERTTLKGTVQVTSGLKNYMKIFRNYAFQGTHDLTDNRHFVFLSYEADLHLCEVEASYIEVRRTNLSNGYADNFEFNYIQ